MCLCVFMCRTSRIKKECWWRSLRGRDHWVTHELDPSNLRLLTTLPRPWNMFSTCLPRFQRLPQGHSLEMVIWYWDHLDDMCVQLRCLCKLLRFWGWVQKSTHLWSLKTSLVHKFPCSLKLPPTDLEWSSSFFSPSLPFVYGGQFQIIPRKLPRRLQINKEEQTFSKSFVVVGRIMVLPKESTS